MLDLIESNEFGDWLIAEIADAGKQSKTVCASGAVAVRVKLENLKIAKKVLLEFLMIQEKMLNAARVNRKL